MRMHSEAFAVYLKFLCIWVGIWCLLDVYIDSGLCGEHPWCLQTSDIVNVKGLQTLSMWDTPALWGQCIRTLFDIWVFDLEVYLVVFTTLTLCWHLVSVVSELLLRYYCIWLSLAEKSSRTFCSPYWFEALRCHLWVKNWSGDGTWGFNGVLYCKRDL